MREASDLAADVGGELHVFHSIEFLPEPVVLAGPYNPTYEDYQGMVEQSSKEQLDSFMRDYPGVPEANIHLREGKPEDTLPTLVREQAASLVVMGAISRGHRPVLLIGSTAENVLDDLPCDILVVKQMVPTPMS
jgi:universal stress protein E